MKKIVIIVSYILFTTSYTFSFDHTHQKWDKILKTYVSEKIFSSTVNYKSLKKNDLVFNQYLAELSKVKRASFNNFSQKQQLSFLINSYNAFTLKLIIGHYPIKSIKETGSFFTNAWEKDFFMFFGKKTNLDYIEQTLIRKLFNEPRIHFALVCASIGCPALKAEAFTANKLEQQFKQQAKRFITDSSRNRYLAKENKLEISKIFDWYGDDFKLKYGSYQAYIANIITDNKLEQTRITKQESKIKFLPYNWSLNETK